MKHHRLAEHARDLRRSAARARCSACSSTGAIAPTASRCGCSARGPPCRPDRRRWPRRPARASCRSRSAGDPTARSSSRWPSPIDVPSSDPAELQRATQAIADALASTIAAAPDQWYSFKPIWPATAEEAADLERAGDADAGGHRRSGAGAGVRLTMPAPGGWLRGPAAARRLVARLPAARAPLVRAGRVRRRPLVPRHPRARGPGAAEPAPGGVALAARRTRAPARPRRRHRPARARAAGSAGLPPRRALLPRGGASAGLRRERYRRERIAVETPEVVAERVHARAGRSIFVGLHFGAHRAARRCSSPRRAGAAVSPMETLDDPALQAWFVRTRGAVGFRHRRAARGAAGAAGRAARGHERRPRRRSRPDRRRHADRAVRRAGPAAARARRCSRSRAARPSTSSAARRAGVGRYIGRLERVDVPAEGSRRERVTATMAAIAQGFERIIEDAPEQWWAVFFPIWPDLEAAAAGRPTPAAPSAGRMTDATPTSRRDATARPRRPAHPHVASDGTADVARSSSTSTRDATSTSSPSRTTSGSTPRVAAQAMARDRGLRVEVVVGEEVTTLGGHLLALWIDRPIRPYRSLRTTIAAVHDAGGLAIPAHPLVPYPLCAQGRVLRRLMDDADPRVHPDAIETFNPTALGRPWHDRVVRFADDHGLAARRQQRRPRARRRSAPAGPTFHGRTAADLRRAIEARATEPRRLVPRHGRPSRRSSAGSCRKRSRDARDELRGRVRRDGTGRDHGYPGGRAPPRSTRRAQATRARRTTRAGDEDRPGLPVHLPGHRAASPSTSGSSTRTCACAGTTSGSSPPATAPSARPRATSSGSASASPCRSTRRSARSPSRRAT